MEAYAAAKAMLFARCDVGVFNGDDPYCARMLEGASCRPIFISERSGDLVAQHVRLGADHVTFDLRTGNQILPVRVGIPGLFTAYNALTVLGLAQALGLPLEPSAQALAGVQGVKGRIEVVPTPGTEFTVLVDYAHTPDGLENILRSARGFAKGRVVAVFGCGGDRDRQKRPIMGRIGVELADLVVFTSDNPRTEPPMAILLEVLAGATGSRTPWVAVEDRRAAIRYALDHGKPGDVIVLAGKGHETYQEIHGVKRHLDEREEVAAWLAVHYRRNEV